MRVHLLAIPNAPTARRYYLDGFAQTAIRFATILKRLGFEVLLYGHEENDAPCDRHYVCITEAQRVRFSEGKPYQEVMPELGHQLMTIFNAKASHQICKVKEPGDVIATISGSASMPVFQQHPELFDLEYSIGYRGVHANYRVYQSEIWRACAHGYTGMDLGRPFDAVIPGFFEVAEFPFVARPNDYVVYCGRVNKVKGIHVACAAAARAGVPLKVIGFGEPDLVTYGDYLGTMPDAERNDLLAHARAVLMPTQYLEAFGNVAIEAQLCGTPVITTDFGAFVETVPQGFAGFRCSTLGEFVQAIEAVGELDRQAIRDRAMRLYSLETATRSYRRYFARLATAHADGWRTLSPTLPLPRYVPSQDALLCAQ